MWLRCYTYYEKKTYLESSLWVVLAQQISYLLIVDLKHAEGHLIFLVTIKRGEIQLTGRKYNNYTRNSELQRIFLSPFAVLSSMEYTYTLTHQIFLGNEYTWAAAGQSMNLINHQSQIFQKSNVSHLRLSGPRSRRGGLPSESRRDELF